MTTRRRRWDVLLSAALFLLLALLFVPECDDCYFIYWDFASWKDFLLVRPIPQEGVVLGVPSNGRYLGNLLGLILGKLAFSPLWPLRVLILGGGMLGLTLLLSRFFQGGPAGGRESFALALFLVVWAPGASGSRCTAGLRPGPTIWPPTLLLLPLLLLLRQGRPDRWPLVLLLSLSIGLFTEHNTAYLVLLSSAMALAGLVPRPPGPPARPVSPGRPAGRQLGRAGPEHDQLRLRSGGQRPAGGGAGSGPGQPACHLYRGPPPPHSPLPDHQPPAAVAGTAAGLPPAGGCGPASSSPSTSTSAMTAFWSC